MSPVGRGLKDLNREIIRKQQGSVSNGARQHPGCRKRRHGSTFLDPDRGEDLGSLRAPRRPSEGQARLFRPSAAWGRGLELGPPPRGRTCQPLSAVL